jgi:UDP-N-acetylmuramyl pentapeptide phosphotransferase/UDP-N-acetylglucosamine-1-phosphate transferase
MGFWVWLIVASAATYLAVRAATGMVLELTRGRGILDRPNPRSSHAVATPTGGGLAVTGVVLAAWAAIALIHAAPPAAAWVVPAAALGLAAISWLDDLRGLAVPVRLGAQLLAVAVALAASPEIGQLSQGLLPGWLETAAAAVLWIWFVNLFNFMDGIDGITGVETASLGLGIAAVAVVAPWDGAVAFYGAVWLLLAAAAAGYWAAALILPLYYLADATLTLLRRAVRREPVWRAHKQHFYQRAHQSGLRHDQVVLRIAAANAALVALALVSLGAPLARWLAVAAAVAVVGGLLADLARRRGG